MRKLYIVSTYYHALVSCAKQIVQQDNADIIVTGYIPTGKSLSEKLADARIFTCVKYIGEIKEYCAANRLDYILNLHRKNAALIESQVSIDWQNYDEINIFHDDTWFAHYLKDKRIPYRLNEDALNSFKSISKSAFSYMLPTSKIKNKIKILFRIGYVFCGTDPCTTEVEVNETDGTEIPVWVSHKLVEKSRETIFNSLTDENNELLCSIFSPKLSESKLEKCMMLFTYPLFSDGLVESENEQIKLYKRIAESFPSIYGKLVIKPHPRDDIDYSQAFPDAILIDKNTPAEILQWKIIESPSITLCYAKSTFRPGFSQKNVLYDIDGKLTDDSDS